MERSNGRSKAFLGITRGTVYTLLVLFIFGMLANQYGAIPENITGSAAMSWVFSNSAIIAIHIVLGVLALVLALAALVYALILRRGAWIVSSLISLAFIILATMEGESFVSTQQTALSSMLMAVGFLGALISSAWAGFIHKVPA